MAKLLAVLVVLVEAAGAAVFFIAGPWPAGVLLVLAAVASGVVGARLWHGPVRPPGGPGYVERESHFF